MGRYREGHAQGWKVQEGQREGQERMEPLEPGHPAGVPHLAVPEGDEQVGWLEAVDHPDWRRRARDQVPHRGPHDHLG